MDAFIVYTLDADNKKTIWKTLYKKWEDATADIQKSADVRYKIHLIDFFSSDFMRPKYQAVTIPDAEKKSEGIQYASVMNGAYRYYIMKLEAA